MTKSVSRGMLIIGLAVLVSAVQAATRFKEDNAANLNTGASWLGGTVPGVNDVALWSNNVSGANAALLGGNMSLQGLWLTSPGGDVAIGGANSLTLGFRGVNLSAATANLTLTNQNLTLLDYTCPAWNIAAGRTFTADPSAFVRGAGATLSVQGSGAVLSAALANDTTGMIGPWARYGTGSSSKYAAMGGGAVVGYAGLAAATAADVADTTGALNYDVAAAGALGAGASFNTVRYTGAGGTMSGGYSANGLLNAGAGVLTMSGAAAIGASKELVLMTPDTTRRIDVTGPIGDHASGASGVTVTGGGQARLMANNSYSGVSVASAGSLYVNKPDALGTTNGNTVVYVSGSASTGGQLSLSGGITLAEPILFTGAGDGDPWHSAMNVVGGGGTNTVTGPVTIATSGGVRFTAGGSGTALNLSGPVTRTTPGSTLILGAGGAGGLLAVNYPINNNGGGVNLHNGAGTVRFNVTGSNLGDINVQYQHVLQLGVSDALPTARSVTVGSSRTQTGTPAQGTFDLAGFSQTVNALNGDGAYASAPPATRIVTNSAPGLSVLTVGSGGSGGTFNGLTGGNLAFVKAGSGTQYLCGPNAYTGGTTVNAGTLVLSNAVSHGALTVNGGTFRFAPSLTVNGSLSGAGGAIDMADAGAVLTVHQENGTFFAGAITNGGTLVKDGSGVLALYGHNTYAGGTVVSNGILILGRPISKPATGTITVAPGALVGLGLGGAGAYSSGQVDALWEGTFDGVTLGESDPVAIDTSLGDATYATGQSTRGLIKTGNNILTLSGANTYPGNTIIRQGVLSIPGVGALPGWNVNGRYQVWRDAALAAGSGVSDAEVGTIIESGNFLDGALIGFDTAGGSRTYASNIANTVNGALGVVKVGTNTLTLSGDSTYDGPTTVNGGVLVVRHSSALGSTVGTTVVNRVGGTAGASWTDATGQLQLDGSAAPLTINENLLINGAEQFGWNGPVRNLSGNNVINGAISLMASGRITVSGGNLLINGPILRSAASAGPALVLNINTGMAIISNRIDLGTGGINFHSGGTVWLCSTGNVWSSYCQVQYGSTLRLGVSDALPVNRVLTLGNSTPGSGRFDLYGFDQTVGGLAEYGTAASLPNNFIQNTHPALPSTLTVSQAAGVSNTFSGRITGAVALVKAGAANSTLMLKGTNTYSGATLVAGGTLRVDVVGTLGSGCTNVTVQSGTLALQNSVSIADSATLTLASGGGAKVDLDASVNESVRYLFIGAKMQRVGTYGSTSSAATHKDDTYFSGSGVLTVLNDNSGTIVRVQ